VIIVAGGGLAGSAAAATLARAGVAVTILERDTFPRDKLCGEFLSGESRHVLQEIGCLDQILKHTPPEIDAMRFVSPRGKDLLVPLPFPALGVSRKLLDHTLLQHARCCGAGVREALEVRALFPGENECEVVARPTGSREDERLSAPVVIATYGRRAAPDQSMERPFITRQSPYVGLKRHFHAGAAGETLGRMGEMYLFAGGYCGVARVERDEVNVCMLVRRELLTAGAETGWDSVVEAIAARSSPFRERLESLGGPASEAKVVAQISFETKEATHGPVFFAGDATGMIAPLCGDGQAMALESGVALTRILLREMPGLATGEDPTTEGVRGAGEAWQCHWRNHYAKRMTLGRTLQSLALKPALAEVAVTLLRMLPGAFTQHLARSTRGRIR